ncbi:MAG: NAD(P)H-hydrate dehydratase [Verrucomicrobiales bacterium]
MAHAAEIRAAIASAPCPLVADADALNALADDLAALDSPGSARLLTPHPGEVAALLAARPSATGRKPRAPSPRRTSASRSCSKAPDQAVAEAYRPVSLNPTGHSRHGERRHGVPSPASPLPSSPRGWEPAVARLGPGSLGAPPKSPPSKTVKALNPRRRDADRRACPPSPGCRRIIETTG